MDCVVVQDENLGFEQRDLFVDSRVDVVISMVTGAHTYRATAPTDLDVAVGSIHPVGALVSVDPEMAARRHGRRAAFDPRFSLRQGRGSMRWVLSRSPC